MIKIMKKNCKNCKMEFYKGTTISIHQWETRTKFCSISCSKTGNKNRLGISYPAWNKGKKLHYQVWNKGNGDYAKKLGFGKWMKGKMLSAETRMKQSEANKRLVQEGKHNFYIDGRTPINQSIRHSVGYKIWRDIVFRRDNFTCVWCKSRCGNGKKIVLHADHIRLFSESPEMRFEPVNGRTLCSECHYMRHEKSIYWQEEINNLLKV